MVLYMAAFMALASVSSCVASMEVDAIEVPGFTEDMERALVDSFLEEAEGMKPRTVEVAMPTNPASPPEPTIASLLPKHLKIATSDYQKDNGGKMPDDQGKLEVHRVAVNSAAQEINEQKMAQKALKEAQKKLRRLKKDVNRDQAQIKQVELNENYAMKKAFQAADRQVKYLKSKADLRHEAATEQLEKMKDTEERVKKAIQEGHGVDEALIEAKQRYLEANDALKVSDQKNYKANTILAKTKHVISNARKTALRKKQFLDNVESHKAKEMLNWRASTQLASYEKGDAQKVGLLLSKLTAKRDAVYKYVKSLEAKTQRDVTASDASIQKAKEDYAEAKSSHAHYKHLVEVYRKKYRKSVKLEKDSRMGVIDGIEDKAYSNALTAARNYNNLDKNEDKWRGRIESAKFHAEQQKDLIGVAEADLERGKALKTKAAKQQYLIDQKKITMRRQLEKIDFLKKQVKKHTTSATNAQVAARRALERAENMEKDAVLARDQAVSRERFVNVIDIPIAKKMSKSAKAEVKRDVQFENEERAEIHQLDRDKRTEALKVKTAKRHERKEDASLQQKLLKARYAKKQLTKAESERDATLAANKEKLRVIKKRLTDAVANFAKAASNPAEEAALAELGEDLDGNTIKKVAKKADTTGAAHAAIDADTDPDLV